MGLLSSCQNNMNLGNKVKVYYFLVKPSEEEISLDNVQQGKESQYRRTSPDMNHKRKKNHGENDRNRRVYKHKLQPQSHCSIISHKKITSFSYQHSIPTTKTHGSQLCWLLGQANFNDYVDFANCRDRFGQFSLLKIDSKSLELKLKVFKEDDKKFPTSTKSYKGKCRLQPTYETTESASSCSSKL